MQNDARAHPAVSAGDQAINRLDQVEQRSAELQAWADRIHQQVAAIKRADEKLQRREEKLKRFGQQLSGEVKKLQEQAAIFKAQQRQCNQLLQRQELLKQAQGCLADSEAAMVNRWATTRATSLALLAIIALSAVGFASFYIAQRLTHPIWQATMVIGFEPAEASEPDLEAWLAAKRGLLSDSTVASEILNQLELRGLKLFSGTHELSAHLASVVEVDSPRPHELQLNYQDVDAEVAVKVLESTGQALLTYEMVQARRAGRKPIAKMLQRPTRGRQPLRDDRLSVAGQLFTGGTVAAGVLGGLAMLVLRRSRRVTDEPAFGQAAAAVDDVARWGVARNAS